MSSRRPTVLVLLIAVLVNGCDPAPPPSSPCGPEVDTVQIPTGGRLKLPHAGNVDGASAEGFRVDLLDDTIAIRAPAHAGDAVLQLSCGDIRREIDVVVTPMRFDAVAEWTPNEADGQPGGREYFTWWPAMQADDDAVYLYGGFAYAPRQFTVTMSLFRFDLATSTWSSAAVAGELPLPGGRVAASTLTLRHFGGAELTDNGSLLTRPSFATVTIGADGTTTFTAEDDDGAPGSYTGSLFFDSRRDRWLSVCGADAISLGLHCQVHSFEDGVGWASVDVDGEVPPGRMGFHYALDEEGDRIVVYGGQGDAGTLADVWTLALGGDRPRWTRHADADGKARRNGAWALDPVGRRLVVWGGTANGQTALPGIDMLRLDDELSWDHLDIDGPAPRASGQCLYDGPRERLLCGFGNGDRVRTDLWALPLLAE
jgi:hypothetical protein